MEQGRGGALASKCVSVNNRLRPVPGWGGGARGSCACVEGGSGVGNRGGVAAQPTRSPRFRVCGTQAPQPWEPLPYQLGGLLGTGLGWKRQEC